MSQPLFTGVCLLAFLFLFIPVSAWADVIISDAVQGTNGSITYPANPNPLGQGDSLTVQAGGSIKSSTGDAIQGSEIGEGENIITVKSGASVKTTKKGLGIIVHGTNTITKGEGPLAEGYSNIVFVEKGSSISTSYEYKHAILAKYNNRLDITGDIETSGFYSYGILAHGNNKINFSGSIRTNHGWSDGIFLYHSGNDLVVSGDIVTTQGHGIHSYGNNIIDMSGTITSYRDFEGIFLERPSSLTMSGTINTYDSAGIRSKNSSNMDVSGTINTESEYANGISAGYNNRISLSGTINTIESDGINVSTENSVVISGQINTIGLKADGIQTSGNGNAVHISGSISTTGYEAFAIRSGSVNISGQSTGEENIFHILNGASINGDIYNGASTDKKTSYLTFGYAKDNDNYADLSKIDTEFEFSLNDNIISGSEGVWDAYISGGKTTLKGTSNEFRNVFLGGASFDNKEVPVGKPLYGGLKYITTTTLETLNGATANLTVTNSISTTGTLSIGIKSIYNLHGTHKHTGSDVLLDGILNLSGGTFANQSAGAVINNGIVSVDAGETGTISGNYTQSENGLVQLQADSVSNHGKMVIGGTANLSANNAIVINVTANDNLSQNDLLEDVISADTLILNKDKFVVYDNSAMWKFEPIIRNNTIDLNYLRATTCTEAISGGSSISSPLASGAASSLDRLFKTGTADTDMQKILNELGTLGTNDEVAQAVAQTVPALAGAGSQIGFDLATNGATQVVGSRLGSFSGLSAGDAVFEDRMAWIKPYYSRTEQDERNGIDGYDADTYGLVIGADGRVHPDWQIGAALSYGTSDIKSDSPVTNQTQDIETWQTTLYANNEMTDTLTLNLIGALGFNTNESSRNILFGGINRLASAEYNSWHTLLDGELTKTYSVNRKLSLGTSLRVQYVYLDIEGYTETGAGGLNLSVEGTNADSLVASIGGKLRYAVAANQNLTAHADVGYDFLADASSLISTYAGGGPSFVIQGNSPDEIVYRGGLGYELINSVGLEIALRYRIESRQDFMNHTGDISLRFPF